MKPGETKVNSRDKIIVALDVPTKADALGLIDQLADEISFYKIGLQLYTAEGPEIVRAVLQRNAKVFLDLKLHDIPNTVAGAVQSAVSLGVHMLTVHLSGGEAMVRAALKAANQRLLVLGVTVLTSADQQTLSEIGIADSVEAQVLRLAKVGVDAGVGGLVASPHELERLRAEFGEDIKIVTPGVRPAGAETNDQKRFMTPREALLLGADCLVIGRPITAAPNPSEAVKRIVEEIEE